MLKYINEWMLHFVPSPLAKPASLKSQDMTAWRELFYAVLASPNENTKNDNFQGQLCY